MALKTFKPYTKSVRGTVLVDKSKLWKGNSYKPLTVGQHTTGARNNMGRITSRHRGGGHKHKYRIIDFLRSKRNIKGVVERIEYDPNRTGYIALIKYEDKDMKYIICPQNLKIGDTIEAGKGAEIKVGNCLELKDIPPGTAIHNIELVPGSGGKLARSAGSSANLSGFDGDHAIIKLGSEGKTAGGRNPVSPWGQSAKGLKTRKPQRSDKLIISRRKKRK